METTQVTQDPVIQDPVTQDPVAMQSELDCNTEHLEDPVDPPPEVVPAPFQQMPELAHLPVTMTELKRKLQVARAQERLKMKKIVVKNVPKASRGPLAGLRAKLLSAIGVDGRSLRHKK